MLTFTFYAEPESNQNIRGLPIYITLIEPTSIYSMFFPKCRLNPRITHAWDHQESTHLGLGVIDYSSPCSPLSLTGYEEMGAEAILFLPLLFGAAVVQSGSPELNKQVYTDIKTWPKPSRAMTLK